MSSEIARYVYCPGCWWKAKTEGVKITAKIQGGKKFHQQVSVNQPPARFMYISMSAILIILLFLIVWRVTG